MTYNQCKVNAYKSQLSNPTLLCRFVGKYCNNLKKWSNIFSLIIHISNISFHFKFSMKHLIFVSPKEQCCVLFQYTVASFVTILVPAYEAFQCVTATA